MPEEIQPREQEVITLRDWFAIAIIGTGDSVWRYGEKEQLAEIARGVYLVADACVAASKLGVMPFEEKPLRRGGRDE